MSGHPADGFLQRVSLSSPWQFGERVWERPDEEWGAVSLAVNSPVTSAVIINSCGWISSVSDSF